MKELILNNGGRPVYTDDIKIIQDNIALIEHFLSLDTKISKQGCVLCGCQLEYSQTSSNDVEYNCATITEGYVFLEGKVRHVAERIFAWKKTEVSKYPFYIAPVDTTSEELISYQNGRTANLYNEYSAKAICDSEKSQYPTVISLKYSTTDDVNPNRFPNFYDLWDGTTDSALIHDFKIVIEEAKKVTTEAEDVVGRAEVVEKEAESAVENAKAAIVKANTAASECSAVAAKIDAAVDDCIAKTQKADSAANDASQAADDCREEIALSEEIIKQAQSATFSANTATINAISATSGANSAAARADKATQVSINQTELTRKATDDANKTIASVNSTVSQANQALNTANQAVINANTAITKTNTAISNAETAIANVKAAEDTVSKAESTRVSNENARITAENKRASQEASRVTEFNTAKTNSETQTNICESYNNHPPKIGSNNNWWFWNPSTSAYYDSGNSAKGGVVYPVFEHEGNKLYLTQCPEELQRSFGKQGNKLTFKINI